MDWSRQGLTKNESLRSESPTSYLILKNTHPQVYPQRPLTPSGGLEGALQRGGSELAGPRWVLRLFLRDFCETGERAASGET